MNTLLKRQSNAALFRQTWRELSQDVPLPPVGGSVYRLAVAAWRARGAPRSLAQEFIMTLACESSTPGNLFRR